MEIKVCDVPGRQTQHIWGAFERRLAAEAYAARSLLASLFIMATQSWDRLRAPTLYEHARASLQECPHPSLERETRPFLG